MSYMKTHIASRSEIINQIVKWTAFVVTIAGAVANAYLIVPYNIYLGNIGAALYMTWAVRSRDWNIAIVNLVLMVIYASGLFVY